MGIALLFIGALIVAFILAVWISSDKSPIGHWITPQAQKEYVDSYDCALRTMPEPTQARDIQTRYGTVRVYQWAAEKTESGIPVLLLPGRSAAVPLWSKNLGDFVQARTVYALDVLGDAGMSVQTSPIKTGSDQASWLEEVLSALGLATVHVVGHSFGGWLAANYACTHPDRIASLGLIEPVFTFQLIRPMIILKSIPYSIKFLPKTWRQALIEEIASTDDVDESDPVARMVIMGAHNYLVHLPPPTQIKPGQLRAWTFPVYVALAGKSAIHNSAKGLEVAKANVKILTAKIWPEATHSLPMEYPELIDREILDFMDEADVAA